MIYTPYIEDAFTAAFASAFSMFQRRGHAPGVASAYVNGVALVGGPPGVVAAHYHARTNTPFSGFEFAFEAGYERPAEAIEAFFLEAFDWRCSRVVGGSTDFPVFIRVGSWRVGYDSQGYVRHILTVFLPDDPLQYFAAHAARGSEFSRLVETPTLTERHHWGYPRAAISEHPAPFAPSQWLASMSGGVDPRIAAAVGSVMRSSLTGSAQSAAPPNSSPPPPPPTMASVAVGGPMPSPRGEPVPPSGAVWSYVDPPPPSAPATSEPEVDPLEFGADVFRAR